MKRNIEDTIFERLRALERGNILPPKSADEKIDLIFEKLRDIEKRTDKLDAMRLQIIGGVAVLGFIFELAIRLYK